MEDFELIRLDQTPTSTKWKFYPLYKENEHSRLQLWQVGYDDTTRSLILLHGLVDGVIQSDGHEVFLKSKASHSEQALVEARDYYRRYFRNKGYRPQGEVLEKKLLMRGQLWDEAVSLCIPFGMMPKLDGVRGGCSLRGDEVAIRSSNNINYQHLSEQREEIKLLFDYLPALAEIDMEIYHPAFSLPEINSIMRTQKSEHPDNKKMMFFIFDLLLSEDVPFEERYEILKKALLLYEEDGNPPLRFIRLLPLVLAENRNEISKYFAECLSGGYEGIIIRCLAKGAKSAKDIEKSMYHSGKSSHFYKLKKFTDEEGVVVGVIEGKGKFKGAAILQVRDPRGNIVNVVHHGTMAEKRKMYECWCNAPQAIRNRHYKYKFQELSEDGIARHPVGISFRDIDLPPSL